MTATWNPWGLDEIDAAQAKKIIEAVKRSPHLKSRVEKRSGHYFLAIFDSDIQRNWGGADLIAKGDVGAVREILAA